MSDEPPTDEGPKGAKELAAVLARVTRFAEMLRDGATVPDARLEVDIPPAVAGWLSRQLNYSIAWRTHYCGSMPNTELVQHYMAGITMSRLAVRAGVTRQRVEQALHSEGVDTKRQTAARIAERENRLLAEHKQNREQGRQRRYQESEEHYRVWRELWAQGHTMVEMADSIGVEKGTIASTISNLRAKYGWFPYRRSSRWRPARKPLPEQFPGTEQSENPATNP